MTATPITPVTLLTGFLGSGKTTLLNRLGRTGGGRLRGDRERIRPGGDRPRAGADGLGEHRAAAQRVRVLPGGGRPRAGDAGPLLPAGRGEVPDFRRAIVETTGLADPAPLARTLIELPLVAARYSLSGIVTTVDGTHGLVQLDTHPRR